MILGTTTFTFVHVVISLAGILSGLVVLFGLIAGKRLDGWTALFLITTVATSVTGFMFPFHKLLPSHVVGAISLVVLAITILARYSRHLAGGWRLTYVISAVIALYLNVFVLIVQLSEKVPALNAMAPTQSELPFKITQVVVMALFVVLGIFAAKGCPEKTVRVQDRTARAACSPYFDQLPILGQLRRKSSHPSCTSITARRSAFVVLCEPIPQTGPERSLAESNSQFQERRETFPRSHASVSLFR